MTKQDKLIKELKELKGDKTIKVEYCDMKFSISICKVDGGFYVFEGLDDNFASKCYKTEIEVVEYIYGEYKEKEMTTPQEVKAHLIKELKEEKANLEGLLEDLQEAAAFYEKEIAKKKKRLEDIEVHLLRNKDFPDVKVISEEED